MIGKRLAGRSDLAPLAMMMTFPPALTGRSLL